MTAVRDAGLKADLRLLLYVRAKRSRVADAEVWLCQNADDVLIYQGHVLSGPLDKADNGRNTLLLARGIKGTVEREGEGFKATNPSGGTSTEYHVTRQRLLVRHVPGGREEEYRVVIAKP